MTATNTQKIMDSFSKMQELVKWQLDLINCSDKPEYRVEALKAIATILDHDVEKIKEEIQAAIDAETSKQNQ